MTKASKEELRGYYKTLRFLQNDKRLRAVLTQKQLIHAINFYKHEIRRNNYI